MILLAHRGCWSAPTERNSKEAIMRAFNAGFGVETDVRDHDGELVVAHDPPRGRGYVPFEWVIETFAQAGQPGALAINIKADGLQVMLAQMLIRHSITRAFLFDMAPPDAIKYVGLGVPTFTRHSEVEPVPAFYAQAQGVWMDCFRDDWADASQVRAHRERGKQVALVSPELHGRPKTAAWREWRKLDRQDGVMLCTDTPYEWGH